MGKKLKSKINDLKEYSSKLRYPKGDEVIGVVEKRLGGSRMKVRDTSGKEYLAVVPGKAKKFLWIRENDVVILKPWELDKKKNGFNLQI